MLTEAEKIRAECRRTDVIGPHGGHVSKMIRYGMGKGFLTGKPLEGTASEENLNLAVEIAACILEVNHGEEVGSVFDLSPERKIEVMKRAEEKVKARFHS
jgi:hypothetical protein